MESFVQMFNQSLQTPISYTEVLITNEIYLFQNKKGFLKLKLEDGWEIENLNFKNNGKFWGVFLCV